MSWWSPKPLPRPSRRVRVHWTTSEGLDLTMNGFLIGISDGHYILRRAELMRGADSVEPLNGTIEIPAKRVEFVQVLGPDE